MNTLSDLSLSSTQLPLSVQSLLNCAHPTINTCYSDVYNLIIASNKVGYTNYLCELYNATV